MTKNTKLLVIAAVTFVFAFWAAVAVGVHWAYSWAPAHRSADVVSPVATVPTAT